MATGTLWISRSNHPWSHFSPAEGKYPKELCLGEVWALLGSSMIQCCMGRSSRATSPPCQCHQNLTASPSCSSSGTRRSLPLHPLTSLGQKQIPSPLKGVSMFSLGKEPISSSTGVPPALAQPQQLQLLSQAWLGMEMCSWHRNSAPEPAFGYQPWVWFEILPEEKVHPLAQPFSLRPWRKSPATNPNPSLSSRSSAHLPGEAQAAAP